MNQNHKSALFIIIRGYCMLCFKITNVAFNSVLMITVSIFNWLIPSMCRAISYFSTLFSTWWPIKTCPSKCHGSFCRLFLEYCVTFLYWFLKFIDLLTHFVAIFDQCTHIYFYWINDLFAQTNYRYYHFQFQWSSCSFARTHFTWIRHWLVGIFVVMLIRPANTFLLTSISLFKHPSLCRALSL